MDPAVQANAGSSTESPRLSPVTTREQRHEYHRAAMRPDDRAWAAQRMAQGLGW